MSECRCACGMEILPGHDWTVHADACGCMTDEADMEHGYDRCFIARGVERGIDE